MLHIDLNSTTSAAAASLILSWIEMQHIKVMNVAGPRASKDPDIYGDVFRVLVVAYWVHAAGHHARFIEKLPISVDEAVDRLISQLPLRDRSRIAKMSEDDLPTLQYTLGSIIGDEFGVWTGNDPLLRSCEHVSGEKPFHPERTSAIIIRELWKRLIKTHKLQVLK